MKLKDMLKSSGWAERNRTLRAMVSDELRDKYGIRTVRVRKGDVVKVMRGDFKGVQGKVTDVFPRLGRIAVEGLVRKKVGGQEIPIKVHPSKVMVVELNLEDKRRLKEEVKQVG